MLSQRFERRTFADPFEIYRALRVVNPSPYMVYMQTRGCILVSSSPEILARCVGLTRGCIFVSSSQGSPPGWFVLYHGLGPDDITVPVALITGQAGREVHADCG